jgi:hypothetical protein
MIKFIDNIKFELIWNYGIRISIQQNSNMERVFVALKILASGELLPVSVYALNFGNRGEITSNKRNLSFFRRMDFDEFVDSWSFNEGGIVYGSGEESQTSVNGWEFRYETDISRDNFEGILDKIKGSHLPYA